jgi:hypothetical protein
MRKFRSNVPVHALPPGLPIIATASNEDGGMSDHPDHCPFLNRSDARCSEHFSLNHLDDAFDDCFDRYQSCTVYRELLKERRDRRAAVSHGGRAGFWVRGGFDAVSSNPSERTIADGADCGASATRGDGDKTKVGGLPRFARLTIANRDPQPAPGRSVIPVVPGL